MVVQNVPHDSPLYPHWYAAVDEGRILDAEKLEQRERFRMALIMSLEGVQDFALNSASVRQAHRRVLKQELFTRRDFHLPGRASGKMPEWWAAA